MKLILSADWHIRDDQPECRIDDFDKTIWDKVKHIRKLKKQLQAHIVIAGDIYHRWKSSPALINKSLVHMPSVYAIPGNHDLPNHSLGQIDKSAYQTLVEAKRIKTLNNEPTELDNVWIYGFPFGVDPVNVKRDKNILKIAVIHRLITQTKNQLWRNTDADDAPALLKQLSGFDIVLTGDNHKTFTCKHNKTLLINPGSFTRQTAAQMEHEPCIFIYDTDNGSVKKTVLPHVKKSISRKHIEKEEQKNERMESFIKHLDSSYEIGLSFEKNVENYFIKNETTQQIQTMIWESISGEKNG